MKPLLAALFIFNYACGPQPRAAKPPASKHYALVGKVISVDARQQTAAIDAAAMPPFMEAMTMDYPIESKEEFAVLHPGDKITGTVDVGDDGSYTLTHIKLSPAVAKK